MLKNNPLNSIYTRVAHICMQIVGIGLSHTIHCNHPGMHLIPVSKYTQCDRGQSSSRKNLVQTIFTVPEQTFTNSHEHVRSGIKGVVKRDDSLPPIQGHTHLNYVNLLLGNGLSLFSLIYYHHPRDFTDTQRDCVWSLSVRAFPYNWEALEQTTHGRHLRSPLCERTPRNWSRESGSHGERRYLDIGYRSSSLHGFDRTALEGETRITLLWENVQ